jgi:UDP-glucose 4-epimerase
MTGDQKCDNSRVAGRMREIAQAEENLSHKLSKPAGGPIILITGGAGNVGTNLALALKMNGYQPIAFDNMSMGHREPLRLLGVPLIEGDLENYEEISSALRKINPDLVIHAGAYISVGESATNPEKYRKCIIGGGKNLAAAMEEHRVHRLLFSNTAAVYDGTLNKALTEDDPKNPSSVYGESKKIFGGLLESGAFPGISTISLHYFNVCGASEDAVLREDHGIATEGHLIPIACQVALYNLIARFGLELKGYDAGEIAAQYAKGNRTRMSVFGDDYKTPDGTCIRDYFGMQQMIFFHLLAVERMLKGKLSSKYEAYNLGTKAGSSVLQVINAAEKVARETVGLPPLPAGSKINGEERVIPVKMGPRREGDADFLVADPAKALRELASGKTVPEVSLEENIRRAFLSILYRPLGYRK